MEENYGCNCGPHEPSAFEQAERLAWKFNWIENSGRYVRFISHEMCRGIEAERAACRAVADTLENLNLIGPIGPVPPVTEEEKIYDLGFRAAKEKIGRLIMKRAEGALVHVSY